MTNCSPSNMTIAVGEWFHFVAYDIMLPPYLIIGLSGNIILLIAFYKQSKTENCYTYQVLLTASKTMEVLIFGGFEMVLNKLAGIFTTGALWFQWRYILMSFSLSFGAFLHIHFIISSLLLATAMAADRVFVLALPFRYKNLNYHRHQAVAGVTCFTLPAIVSISYYWSFRVVPEGDHYVAILNESHVESTLMQVCSRILVIIRFVSLGALIALNVIMVRCFRRRTSDAAKITNFQQRVQARKELSKALLLLNIWQSVLMCINQLPHVSLHTMIFIAPNFTMCYAMGIPVPLADAFIFLTDSIDLMVVLAINKSMRHIVTRALGCSSHSEVKPIK